MAISGTYTYNDFRNDVVKDALSILEVYSPQDPLDPADIDTCSRFLNRVLKHMATDGLHLWKRAEAFLIPQNGQYQYSIGTGGDVAVSSYVDTTISADEAAGQTILSITSNSGFVNGDNILIQLDSGDLQATTIVSSTSTTVTVAAALTGAAASGNVVYVYDTDNIIIRPLKLLNIRRRIAGTNLIDTQMQLISYEEYQNYPYKNNSTTYPTQAAYTPNRESTGTLYLWGAPNDVTVVFPFTYEYTLADVTGSNQTFDVPQEWLLALTYKLAVAVAPIYGKSAQLPTIKALADEYYNAVLTWDNETVSVAFEPNSQMRGG